MIDDENIWNNDNDDDEDITAEAVERFEAMLEQKRPTYFDAEEFELIIDYYMEKNDLQHSREAVDLAMQQHPDDTCLRIKNARQFLVENNPQKALDLMFQIDGSEDEEDYYLTLGSCYAALGKHQQSIDSYAKAMRYYDEDERGELYHAIGYEYQCLSLYSKAIEYYKKSLSFPELITCFLTTGKTQEGIAYFNQRIEEYPADTEAWSALGDIYRRLDRLEDAIEMYEYVLAIDPTHLWANMHLANSYYDLDRFQEAIDSLHEAIDHGVDTSMIHASLGDCHYRKGEFIDAKNEYNQALKRNEYLTEAWSGLGYVYSDTGNSAKAIRFFEKAYRLEPFNDDHLYNLAAEYHKINENEKALEYLLEIEQHQPDDPDLYFFLGDLLADMNRVDEAICYLKIGLERTENEPTLLYLLAYLHLERGERVKALAYLEEALKVYPEYYKEFIEYNPELITNDVDVMELIHQYGNHS